MEFIKLRMSSADWMVSTILSDMNRRVSLSLVIVISFSVRNVFARKEQGASYSSHSTYEIPKHYGLWYMRIIRGESSSTINKKWFQPNAGESKASRAWSFL